MPFVDRNVERTRLAALARDVQAGTPERHLALVGPRRIGKSKIIEDYLARESTPASPVVVALLAMDGASATLQTYLIEMVRAVVAGFSRRAGRAALGAAASLVELVAEAAIIDPRLAEALNGPLRLHGAARPDGHQVFVAATSLPEEAARATGIPVIVLVDEFQHIADLSAYAPFRARGGVPSRAARDKLLSVFRATVERRPGVGWVVTGSGIRLMTEILGQGPLMGRFDILRVAAFGPGETRELARQIWAEQGIAYSEEAADRVDRLTLGHPFYADVVCRGVAFEAHKLDGRAVPPEFVDLALLDSLMTPTGAIWIACQEIWDSLLARTTPALRGLVLELAQRGDATVSDLASAIGLTTPSTAWQQVRELEGLGLVERADNDVHLVDPIFRYWLNTAWSPGAPPLDLADPAAAQRAIRHYQDAYIAQRADRGRLVEAYMRDLVRNFDGQSIEGKRFGRPGHVRLPRVTDVRQVAVDDAAGEVFGRASEVELDLCFGDGSSAWLAEVRDRTDRPAASDIEILHRKAAVIRRTLDLPDGETWFVSFSGFGREARQRAEALGILVSGKTDVEAIGAATGIRRQ